MPKTATILDQYGSPLARGGAGGNGGAKALVRRRDPELQARYDAAQTSDDNKRHWGWADLLGPVAANNPAVRQVLRSRARYEVANNAYAKGITLTLANDTIGTGPRLQLLTDDGELNDRVEREFKLWARAVNLAAKLRTLRMARTVDGEGFLVLRNNPAIGHRVKLDPLPIEADRVTTPEMLLQDPLGRMVDGIVFDAFHNPVTYHVLHDHPGEQAAAGNWGEYDSIAAEYVIHYFRPDRAGQERGIPDLTPALPLFAQLRRYTLAVIAAAETAADFAAVLYTDGPPDERTQPDPYDLVDLERRMGVVLPDGYKLGQITPQQPAQTYPEFKQEIISEIARCLNVPFNIAALTSAKHNYAGAQLDQHGYIRATGVERNDLEVAVLDRLWTAWLRLAATVGVVPERLAVAPSSVAHEWRWDGFAQPDPVKAAKADQIDLANFSQTEADIAAKKGGDWETNLKMAARILQRKKELGLVTDSVPVDMTAVARAVRAGVPVGVAEARAALGLPEELPEGSLLRFNDQDVLQYHIESGVLTINEVRDVLGLDKVSWGDVPVRRNNVSPVSVEEDGDAEEGDPAETEDG